MPGFNTLPAVGGGGGQANMTYVASIHMSTYNRSWAQGGTPGYYSLYSTNQENGYAYFVGATTTGVALNRLANITHSFTRIDIVAPQNDMISLYKAKVKATTEFTNPFVNFSSFPSTITTSGNFVLPNNALPLVNVMLVGAGGGGGRHGGGGGGGGGIVKLTAYQAVGTTSVTIGAAGRAQHRSGNDQFGAPGGATYFGNVYALGGGGGAQHGHGANNTPFTSGSVAGHVANGGGGGGHNNDTGSRAGGTGYVQTSTTGLGTTGTPVYVGGNTGGTGHNSNGGQGGGGAGAGGNGINASGDYNGFANGGSGHASDIAGVNTHYSVGGSGGVHGTTGSRGPGIKFPTANWINTGTGMGGFGGAGDNTQNGGDTGDNVRGWDGGVGTVVVRYYIP